MFGTRYVDVGSGGPAPFSFNVSTNATWLTIEPTEGYISTENPEQRVYASVTDWDALEAGTSYATLRFTSQAEGQKSQSVVVTFVAKNTKGSLDADFTGEPLCDLQTSLFLLLPKGLLKARVLSLSKPHMHPVTYLWTIHIGKSSLVSAGLFLV